ncbi:MAG: precorrin-8X methylmutase [Thiohalocapsa sp. PB-PSB1]|nr:MAG: precorrin-8X methylmutase [Thiohalocapsa sp. PB-PSB1]
MRRLQIPRGSPGRAPARPFAYPSERGALTCCQHNHQETTIDSNSPPSGAPVAGADLVSEQQTAAGRSIEHTSFDIIDAEIGSHAYSTEQWPIVRRMIHASADFELNGLTEFHPSAVSAGLAALAETAEHRGSRPLIADVGMILAGLSSPRLHCFGLHPHQFIADADVIAEAQAQGSTRAVLAMRKARSLGLLDDALVGIGNAPTALIELVRLIEQEQVRPALVIGMPVGFVAAAESKALLADLDVVPWIIVRGRKGGSPLVVAAIHALLALADAERPQIGQPL